MTKYDKKLVVYTVVLILVSACFNSKDGPRTGGHTNWLKCQSLDDCELSSRAVDCKNGYCVDTAGERIISAVNDLSVDSSVHDNGDHDGGDGMLAGLVERTFLLESSRGFEPVTGTTVRLLFSEEGEMSFSAGCNHHGGAVEVRDGYLWVASLGSTEIGCISELQEQDDWLAQFFTSGPAVTVDGDRMTLTSDESKLVFLDREVADPDRPLVGPLWTVDTFIEGGGQTASSQTMQENPTLMFSDDGRVSVVTPCNTSTGRYSVAGEELTLSGMLYTEAVCNDVSAFRAEKVQAVMRDGTLSFEIEAARLTLMRGDLGLGALAP